MTNLTPAIIYARFSDRPDNETEVKSNDLQKDHCESYAKIHSYAVLGFFGDEFMSGGRADNRPQLQLAIAAACEAKGTLIVYSLSRLARNVQDALHIAETLQKAGAHLAILDINMDTSTPVGRCVFTILAAVAELERNQIKTRTSDAMKRMVRDGHRVSFRIPYGWKEDENSTLLVGSKSGQTYRSGLVQDDTEQATLQTILHKHSKGTQLRKIIEHLHATGQTFRGHTWHPKTLARIIKRHAS